MDKQKGSINLILIFITVVLIGFFLLKNISPTNLRSENTKPQASSVTNTQPLVANPTAQPFAIPASELEKAKQWDKDAYLIAITNSNGILSTSYTDSRIFASPNKNEYLFFNFQCCGGEYIPKPVIITKDQIATNSFITLNDYPDYLNLPQLASDNQLSPDLIGKQPDLNATTLANQGQDTVPITYLNFNFPDTKGPQIINNWPSKEGYITINNQTFAADRYTIQVNNSKKYGLLYQIIFSTRKSPDSTNQDKVTAILSVLSTGEQLSFKTF